MIHPVTTVTLNPAIDQTLEVDHLTVDQLNRVDSACSNAGGKGINVASCLADWGIYVCASGLLGNDNSELFTRLFKQKKIRDNFVRFDGETRTNIKIVNKTSGGTTDLNMSGQNISQVYLDRLLQRLSAIENGSILVLSGSLPPGCPEDFYTHLMQELAPKNLRIIVDTSGPALSSILTSHAPAPFMIKPNLHELETYVGRDLKETNDIIHAAQELTNRGIEKVIVSLGSEGSLFFSNKEALHARPPKITSASSVGAGDAMVAGLVAAALDDLNVEEMAKLATAFAVGKLELHGPNLPSKERINALAKSVTTSHINN
ncbi:1-phosphofructokinase [Methylophaga thalassica]|uniref:1-phosphofructokinase n=1 Tax=Methylophaga thalassica TaxID=40223 RepID=UPI002E7ACEA6|nr:1-phosphofructokinase [Methylophaga thalassica]WVI83976.1 1-phosphofructokinase [Methylophaga thalassica]